MRERAAVIGARLTVTSAPGRGTEVVAAVSRSAIRGPRSAVQRQLA
jgi:nitrate/nitrite-specific signal transduction histidine kinase